LLVNAPAVGSFPNSGVYSFYSSYAKQFPSMAQRSPEQLTKASGKIGDFDGVLVDGKGALQPSYTAVKQVLPILPKDRKIITYTMNDDSGMGALRALEQSDRADDFVIMSQGADANGLKQLRTNRNWVAEGSVFFDLWPSYVMAMSKALASGVKAPELTPAPQIVLTKDTVDDYYKGMAVVKSPPVAPEAEYLRPFGIK
jgi:ribose transport system substrate-binding protein